MSTEFSVWNHWEYFTNLHQIRISGQHMGAENNFEKSYWSTPF